MEDEDDFVVYGTPLEREEDVASNKKKRQALDQGRLRAGSFSQEVYDENGRRRFHGAFTGGFSAGYYNTVGSKEGWVPQSFTSSRKNRMELALQKPYDYMDDEERAEQDSTRLVTTSDYDTFALTAADLARKEASQELKKRPSAIPGLPPDDSIVPVSRSIGYELLRKMGWRHGRSIGPKHIAASSAAQHEGRKAMLAFAQSGQDRAMVTDEAQDVTRLESDADVLTISTPIYVRNPKKDRYGFGFDPYKNAPEFRERRRNNEAVSDATKAEKGHHSVGFKSSLFRPNVGKMGGGFGIGALEELGEEDEDVYAPDLEIENILSDHDVDTASLKSDAPHPKQIEWKSGVLPGFRPASRSGSKIELFPPPVVPPDFNGKHQFRDSLESETKMFSYEPPEVAPPEEIQLKKLIDGLATFVARSGQKLENLYMDKRNGDSMYSFLNSGNGHEYYKRRLWEEQKNNLKEGAKGMGKESPLDSVERGQLLGEIPLQRPKMVPPEDRARLQSALSSAFTTSKDGDCVISSQQFSADPSKQARFELYLKDKYQGGLRDVHATGKSTLNELERAQERLEFEAACQSLQKSNSLAPSVPMGIYQKDLQAIMSERFTVQSTEKTLGGLSQSDTPLSYPVREEKPWRPRPLLCKRFELPDPYSGKPPPLPKPRSRTESFILLSGPVANTANPSKVAENQPPDSSASMDSSTHHMNQTSSSFPIQHLETENQATMIVEKPVDLYKAIFSDDSDDENADSQDQGAHPISAEAAHAALNRLEAGDFLASIGKELGLQLPPAEANQLKRTPTASHQAHAIEVIKKYHSPSSSDCQIGKPADQNLNVLGKAMEAGKEWHENTESKGVFLDYPRLELSAEHFDVFSKLSSRPSLPKNVSEGCHSVKAVSEDELLATNMSQESPNDSSSDESSDSHRKRQSRKRKKKGHRHSKSDRRQSGKDYKRRKVYLYTH